MKTRQLICGLFAVIFALTFTACKNEPTHTHEWRWTVTTPATCIATGEELGVCKLDPSHTTTREIPIDPDGHDWNHGKIITLATCTEAGEETAECKLCGAKDDHHPTPINPDAHDWNSVYTTINAATETTNGIEAVTCKRNSSHTKQRFNGEYATGTAELKFDLIDNDTAYRVSKGTATGAIYIPAYLLYNGNYLPVTEVSNGYNTSNNNAFGGTSSGITSVTFAAESQLTNISNFAFYMCSSLTSVNIPAGVTTIGNYAFSSCTNLTSVTIPTGVTSIGDSAFSSCTSLTGITIPNSVTSIGNGAFAYSSLTSVTIPAGVTSIGSVSFAYCTSLTSVTIHAGVTSIGSQAFLYCRNLTSVTIYADVTSIGYHAFRNCTNLTEINIPESVTSISFGAFYDCSSLTSITIPASVTSLNNTGSSDFYGIFSNCTSLKTVTFAANSQLKIIGEDTFSYCKNLISINIPAGVTSIGDYSFSGCRSLTSITLPEGLMTIGTNAFSYCTGITAITIPASVTSMGPIYSPFRNWTSSQIINIEGHADQASADAAWGANWRTNCNAVINYLGS